MSWHNRQREEVLSGASEGRGDRDSSPGTGAKRLRTQAEGSHEALSPPHSPTKQFHSQKDLKSRHTSYLI